MDFWNYKYPDLRNSWISWIRSSAKWGRSHSTSGSTLQTGR
uniref:Uncharacterized protein n=1 Tax=Arundo donax TaxID=35708 RepID=A0A0A9ABZ8_ARUDO